MAYSLNDVYRSLRPVMRFNGLVVGVGLGLILLILPGLFMPAGPAELPPAHLWPFRMAGAGLITLGLHLLFAAQERMIRASTLLAMLTGNGLIAVVLLIAFVQREFVEFSTVGQLVLGTTFFVCLVGAGFALRYLREDYNMA